MIRGEKYILLEMSQDVEMHHYSFTIDFDHIFLHKNKNRNYNFRKMDADETFPIACWYSCGRVLHSEQEMDEHYAARHAEGRGKLTRKPCPVTGCNSDYAYLSKCVTC